MPKSLLVTKEIEASDPEISLWVKTQGLPETCYIE